MREIIQGFSPRFVTWKRKYNIPGKPYVLISLAFKKNGHSSVCVPEAHKYLNVCKG